ncbi:TadG family pilus assembly protein [Variovorax sp. RHLX14]|uniref:TadG family pilus assembly protein n=1 Tax=Variovorax sp. RHLX14 TaxID=1259731 RepID=UPI003F46F836
MHTPYFSSRLRRRRQRGSVVVTAAMALSLIVAVLLGSEIAYLFYMKREFQKTADLAALAGAQRLLPSPGVDTCANAKTQATQNAARNLAGIALSTIECGQWAGSITGERHFTSGGADPNALRVTIRSAPPVSILPHLGGARTIAVEALAMLDAPIAAISVTPRLMRFNGDSTLGASLKAIGLNIDNSILVGYEGLATVPITPGGLLCAIPGAALCPAASISVASLNSLIDTDITLGQLLDAVVAAGGRTDLLSANVALVNALKTALGATTLDMRLGSASGASALFATITASNGYTALASQLNALDVIRTAIGVASSGHAVSIPSLNISLIGLASVTAKIGVVEPPSIAIGRKGITAYSAQMRTFIHVRSDDALIGSLLAPLIKLNLPIVLDVISAQAKLEDLCTPALATASNEQRAVLSATGALAKSCIGRIANASGTQDCAVAATAPAYKACFDQLLFSKRQLCDDSLFDMELVNVLGLLKTTNHLRIAALPLDTPSRVTLQQGETGTLGNNLAIGSTVSNLVSQTTTLLFTNTSSSGTPSSANLTDIANQIWNDSGRSAANGGAGCTADTTACRASRLANAKQRIEANAAQSGLLSGLVNGIGDLLGAVGGLASGDGCSYTGLFGTTSNAGCVTLLKNTLTKASGSSSGGTASNSLAVLAGMLKPVLNAIGANVLTPLLQNVLGIYLGQVDVKVESLQCGNSKLVY